MSVTKKGNQMNAYEQVGYAQRMLATKQVSKQERQELIRWLFILVNNLIKKG
jgi:hypothetical protein